MKRAGLTVAIAAALLTSSVATSSFALTPPAPVEAPAPPRPTYTRIGVNGFSPALKPGGTFISQSLEPTLLRRAEPDGDIRDWLPETDPAVAVLKASKQGGGQSLELQIDALGRATGCKVMHQYGDAAFAEGLCDRVVPRVRMKRAIDTKGAPIADVYVYSILFNQSYQPPERLVDIQMFPPAPMPPDSWPPRSATSKVTVTKLDLLEGGPSSPDATGAPWAGVMYAPNDKRTQCRVIASSGDLDFNRRACAAAAKGKYDVSNEPNPHRQRVYLHFAPQKGKARALLAVAERRQVPTATPDSAAAVVQTLSALPAEALAKLRLHVLVDKAGAITGCMILESTGTDAGDVLACDAVRRLARFAPAQDAFGRPIDGGYYNWNPAAAPRAD